MLTNNWMRKKISSAYQHQQLAFDLINNLAIKKREGKCVLLSDNTKAVEFVSCSYLGLDQDSRLLKACSKDLSKYGVSFHAARTRLQPENYLFLDELLHQIYCNAYPITFPSIHMAHQAIFPLLSSGEMLNYPISAQGILFIMDRSAHSSMQINRGLLQQFGEIQMVDFQEINELESAFESANQQRKTPIAIADSLGSMGGEAPIHELIKMAEDYCGYIYLDDAHGTSIHGKRGSGYILKVLNYTLHPRLIFCASLGKGFGSLGGVLLFPCSSAMNFVKQFGSTYVFAGPPALCVINVAIASAELHLSGEVENLQARLWNNVNHFDRITRVPNVVNFGAPSPIRGLLIGDECKAVKCAMKLKRQGFLVTTALYPTVAKGKSMLRIALSSAHEKSQIESLSAAISALL